jgi:hypothetical protein
MVLEWAKRQGDYLGSLARLVLLKRGKNVQQALDRRVVEDDKLDALVLIEYVSGKRCTYIDPEGDEELSDDSTSDASDESVSTSHSYCPTGIGAGMGAGVVRFMQDALRDAMEKERKFEKLVASLNEVQRPEATSVEDAGAGASLSFCKGVVRSLLRMSSVTDPTTQAELLGDVRHGQKLAALFEWAEACSSVGDEEQGGGATQERATTIEIQEKEDDKRGSGQQNARETLHCPAEMHVVELGFSSSLHSSVSTAVSACVLLCNDGGQELEYTASIDTNTSDGAQVQWYIRSVEHVPRLSGPSPADGRVNGAMTPNGMHALQLEGVFPSGVPTTATMQLVIDASNAWCERCLLVTLRGVLRPRDERSEPSMTFTVSSEPLSMLDAEHFPRMDHDSDELKREASRRKSLIQQCLQRPKPVSSQAWGEQKALHVNDRMRHFMELSTCILAMSYGTIEALSLLYSAQLINFLDACINDGAAQRTDLELYTGVTLLCLLCRSGPEAWATHMLPADIKGEVDDIVDKMFDDGGHAADFPNPEYRYHLRWQES